jgi:hypothetical protein
VDAPFTRTDVPEAVEAVAEDEAPASPTHEARAGAWQDLSENRAGQAARENAVALKQAAPVKTFVARVLGVHTDERAWRVGCDGEREVGRRLAKLDDSWHVIHAVPVGERGSDIDHVVIGPGGVFTINPKNHSRQKVWVVERAFLVNGQKQPYLRNSLHEARRAAKLLTTACGFDVEAEPVIAVFAADMTIRAHPAGVHVVRVAKMARWLRKRRAVLDPDRVEVIFEHARRDVTWRPVPR